ncbi:hypothetical protein [Candidatus Frankia alpina]|uniref:Glycosyltransferase n=1 Tax=Candidatus Frankia alpina TaxID=2699483 RepID=A0A4V3Z7W8_9ACTN|nr:hypothetical protein [Candidatus Frankia alpina]THJ75809.1 hypothetical protein E7Y31_03270 [Candidatus Frankia alpina]
MPELVVIVPSRGRPDAIVELAAAFRETCTADTWLAVAIDESDPKANVYQLGVMLLREVFDPVAIRPAASTSMVEALNLAAASVLAEPKPPAAIGFMGDDHRPRTRGWDRAYLDALASLPGIVYGNDLLQRANLPTQCAMSTSVVRALGHMAPPVLTHLYVDNYWKALGQAAGCLTYLPHVVVEHVHPITGQVPWDEGHTRVNAPALYEADRNAFEAYWAAHGARDRDAVLAAMGLTG